MHYYCHHIGDYHRDTAHLSILEHGVYRLLMDSYYSTERALPADLSVLCRIVRAVSKTEREAVATVSKMFFVQVDHALQHKRIDRELEDYHVKIQQASKAGRASAAKRQSVTNDQRPFNARSTPVEIPLERNGNGEGNGTATNQYPVSNNQEPITKIKKAKEPKITDEEWMASLKANSDYHGINIDTEYRRAAEWIAKNPGRQLSRPFFINWLSKAEKPLAIKPKPAQTSCLGPMFLTKGHSCL